MAKKAVKGQSRQSPWLFCLLVVSGPTYVKSPVASLNFTCSSVRKRVRVTMSVLMVSPSWFPPVCTAADMMVVLWAVDNCWFLGYVVWVRDTQ